jgi:hypothetical protein
MLRFILAPVLAGLMVSAANAAQTLVYDVTFHDSFITAKTDALSAGDRIIINDELLQDGKKVGMTSGACTITEPVQGYAICNVTFVLADGAVSVQFVNSPPPEKHFAILGGTDTYAGAGGNGVLLEHGDGTGKLTLNID